MRFNTKYTAPLTKRSGQKKSTQVFRCYFQVIENTAEEQDNDITRRKKLREIKNYDIFYRPIGLVSSINQL
jgi:hypothetical protein